MSAPVRWAVLATGAVAAAFTEDLARLPDAEVLAVASRSAATAQAFAKRYGIPRAYGCLQDLLDDADVEIVYVATPNADHHEATVRCIRAGKAVLCEKPFTINAAQAREAVEISRTQGTFLMEAMWMRFNPVVERLAELVREGAIGAVTHVHADLGLREQSRAGHWSRSRSLGGGALLDLGVYGVAFAQMLLGPPKQILAWSSLTSDGIDENAALLLGYPEAVAVISCGSVSDTPCTAAVSGEGGRIELPYDFTRPASLVLRQGSEVTTFRAPWMGHGYCHEAIEAMRCLRAGLVESPSMPWTDTIEVMHTLDRARAQAGIRYPEDELTEAGQPR